MRSIGLAMMMLTLVAPAHAITGALCIKATFNGSLKLRATGICKATEIQIGSFDGTTLQFSGINVQVVSGSGSTIGAVNGKGNLIVGYNEAGFCKTVAATCNTSADCGGGNCSTSGPKIGSHNLIVGAGNSYSSYGGFVAGELNVVSGAGASVSGGYENHATGFVASVSGGISNTASGPESSISGGAALAQPATDGWAAGSATGTVYVGNFESP